MMNTKNVSIHMIVGNSNELLYTKQGDVHLCGQQGQTLLLKKFLYAPSIRRNIVSMRES